MCGIKGSKARKGRICSSLTLAAVGIGGRASSSNIRCGGTHSSERKGKPQRLKRERERCGSKIERLDIAKERLLHVRASRRYIYMYIVQSPSSIEFRRWERWEGRCVWMRNRNYARAAAENGEVEGKERVQG